jgi:glycosyltransferase involved in cell wall biosynthesis
MPRVSVIVPNYNHEQYLAQRLDTIFNQTFQDFEVILLDDCSTDNSRAVIERYRSDARVRILLNERNSGSPFKQWNKGFELSNGEYVWIAESDDYASPELLGTLVARLDAEPATGLAYCQSWITKADPAGTPLAKVERWYRDLPGNERWVEGFSNEGPSELAQFMVFKNTIPNASAVVFRRSLLDEGLRAPEDMHLAGDWMFWVEILLRCGVVYVPEPLNYFRTPHEESQRKKTGKQGLEFVEGLRVYARITSEVPVNEDTRKAVLRLQVKYWGYFAYTRRLGFSTNREIYRLLLLHHPESVCHKYRRVALPFAYYFAAVPFRRVLIFRAPVRAVKWLLRHFSGRLPTER